MKILRAASEAPKEANPDGDNEDSKPHTLQLALVFGLWYFQNIVFNIYNKKVLNLFPFSWLLASFQLFVVCLDVLSLVFQAPTMRTDIQAIHHSYSGSCSVPHNRTHISACVSFSKVAVSFTHVIKSSEPVFSIIFSSFLSDSYPLSVWLSILLIVLGCSLAAVTEVSFNLQGLWGALISNVGFVLRNIYSKWSFKELHVVRNNCGNLIEQDPKEALRLQYSSLCCNFLNVAVKDAESEEAYWFVSAKVEKLLEELERVLKKKAPEKPLFIESTHVESSCHDNNIEVNFVNGTSSQRVSGIKKKAKIGRGGRRLVSGLTDSKKKTLKKTHLPHANNGRKVKDAESEEAYLFVSAKVEKLLEELERVLKKKAPEKTLLIESTHVESSCHDNNIEVNFVNGTSSQRLHVVRNNCGILIEEDPKEALRLQYSSLCCNFLNVTVKDAESEEAYLFVSAKVEKLLEELERVLKKKAPEKTLLIESTHVESSCHDNNIEVNFVNGTSSQRQTKETPIEWKSKEVPTLPDTIPSVHMFTFPQHTSYYRSIYQVSSLRRLQTIIIACTKDSKAAVLNKIKKKDPHHMSGVN
ncbi:hypothetical protein HHK36_004454 [Tetracentron sinense]|uniref:Sugar phosphate transporter domain-containing protein n=1 Tax=Tetracentron sinense TaxID=13715 RepID=A0A834ZR76_TETSI|nr:hypothetical protein HHK36_004454 [Tetracentron sinense]